MIKTTNKNASRYVTSRVEFKANNLKGVFIGKGVFVVYSYNWYPIFLHEAVTDGWYENVDKYSVSTSKHVTQSRPEADVICEVSHNEMCDAIAHYKINRAKSFESK